MSDPALTIPGLYWQIHRLAQTPLDHAGRPAFIGVVPDAGDGEPVLVEGWARYRDRFGGVDAASPAAARSFHLAVRGFFANGGARCRIVPVEGALTASALAAALARLEDEEDTSLVVAPGVVDPALQAAIVTHCEALGDRFAVLDLPEPDALNAVAAADAAIAHAEWLWRAADGRHAALYGPWLKVVAFDGTAFVPPSGHVAGVYARVDARSGPHHAPANEVVEDAVDLRFDFDVPTIARLHPPLALDETGRLAAPSVNVIRVLPGRGMRVWGARTLSGDPTWRHVPVRRLTLDLERWMTRRLDAMVFETNDPLLRTRVIRELGAHLDALYQKGALVGPISEMSWFVQCDETNNPEDVREAGLLIADVGIAPAVPGEYITLRLITRSGTDAQTEMLTR
ncbi:MAG: phage tail sheath subtilisin-like domain-containing protein [bacterium]